MIILLVNIAAAWVGAIRLAKPGTAWFDKYPYAKRRLAWERFENTSFEIAA